MVSEADDPEMNTDAEEEEKQLAERKVTVEPRTEISAVAKDPNDEKNVIVEIRGQRAATKRRSSRANCFRMYSRYAEVAEVESEILESSPSFAGWP